MSTIELDKERTAPALPVTNRPASRSIAPTRPDFSNWLTRSIIGVALLIQITWLIGLGWFIKMAL